MQFRYNVHITSHEWRWVILISAGVLLLSALPLLILALQNGSGASMQFMGAVHDPVNAAAYMARIAQGTEWGGWMLYLQHTPEPQTASFIHAIYMLLGQLARLIDFSPVTAFHIARVCAAMLMYMAIYYLSAIIWMRVRTRRIFFLFAVFGSGFGWLLSPLLHNANFPDLIMPEVYPLLSSLIDMHTPLAIACTALLAGIIIYAFRPGMEEDPSINNGGLSASLLSFLLAMLYSEMILPLACAFLFLIGFNLRNERRIILRALRWLMVVLLPTLPVGTYYLLLNTENPVISLWTRQQISITPAIPLLLAGFGLPLLIALPGIYRALRRFEPDGDRFLLIWLVSLLVFCYLPTTIQGRFLTGAMLPIAYFATRATEDTWFQIVRARWRYRLLVAIIPVMVISPVIVLFAPLSGLSRQQISTPAVLLSADYGAAFEWLRENTQLRDVILASPRVSLWVPVWTGARVVYGHPTETLDADRKLAAVLGWYQGNESADCVALLNGGYSLMQPYRVQFVLIGPEEQRIGQTACLDYLELAAQFGAVLIYTPIPDTLESGQLR